MLILPKWDLNGNSNHTKVLNQAVKRNIERFPDIFRFQLSENEKNELVTICDRFSSLKYKQISKQLGLDQHNEQYPEIVIRTFDDSHDRFLILDQQELYLLSTSLEDFGEKWFALSKMDSVTGEVLNKLIG
jgi:spore cortex formation protein SpoVR/YcgB (stage V sporulation)